MNRSPLRRSFLLTQLIVGVAFFWLAPLIHAQCPQICDSNANAALGDDALINNTSGIYNTAIGDFALQQNTVGVYNTATGASALEFNTIGDSNTANGAGALGLNNTGNHNTASGFDALELNTTGSNNIALGASAGSNLTTGRYNIHIGNQGEAREANTIHIGTERIHTRTFMAGITGVTVPEGVGVIVGSNGKLGTVVSSARFKETIKPMDKASEAILALKPVTFRYKHELDPAGIPQFDLVAEELEKVNPDLVARDEQGKPFTVRYEAVNAMLLQRVPQRASHGRAARIKNRAAGCENCATAKAN